MRSRSAARGIPVLVLLLASCFAVPLAEAGIGDVFKKKADEQKKKAEQEAAKKAAEAVSSSTSKPAGSATPDSANPSEAGAPAATAAAPAAATKVSQVSTKFDYVPGDKVLLQDDFRQDELGEFPVKWKPERGTFEVAESGGERWLRSMSPDGAVRLRLPEGPLPEYWTLEFDFLGVEPLSSALSVRGLAKGDHEVWVASYPSGTSLTFRSGEFYSSTPFEGIESPAGRFHVMLMARGKGLKVYMEQQRLVNLPEVSDQFGPVVALELRLWANTQPMVTNVRFAEGCKPAQDLLATGKLVTYGIRFATGSDVVLPESAPVLRQVAAWLTANPAAKLSVTGHTDNVGKAADNLDLSQRRATSVVKVLVEQFSIAPDRLTPQGKGDTQSVADNAKPEGRAMNRRVEFAKL